MINLFPYKKIELTAHATKEQVVEEFKNSIQMTPMKLFKNEKGKSFYGSYDDKNKFILRRKKFERNTFATEIVISVSENNNESTIKMEIVTPFLTKFFVTISFFVLILAGIEVYKEGYLGGFFITLLIPLGIYLFGLIGYYLEYDNSVKEVNKVLKRINYKFAS